MGDVEEAMSLIKIALDITEGDRKDVLDVKSEIEKELMCI
jgi:hypothetical protein